MVGVGVCIVVAEYGTELGPTQCDNAIRASFMITFLCLAESSDCSCLSLTLMHC